MAVFVVVLFQLTTVKAKLQQLECMYERTDREKLETVLHARTLQEQVDSLEVMLGN